jgi:hypothetical protein
MHYPVQQAPQGPELGKRQTAQAVDEANLGGNRSPGCQALPCLSQPQLTPAPVSCRRPARDQSLLNQPANHHRHRALVGIGALGQLIDGARLSGRELLKHEKLRASNAEFALRRTGGTPEYPDYAPDRVEYLGEMRLFS